MWVLIICIILICIYVYDRESEDGQKEMTVFEKIDESLEEINMFVNNLNNETQKWAEESRIKLKIREELIIPLNKKFYSIRRNISSLRLAKAHLELKKIDLEIDDNTRDLMISLLGSDFSLFKNNDFEFEVNEDIKPVIQNAIEIANKENIEEGIRFLEGIIKELKKDEEAIQKEIDNLDQVIQIRFIEIQKNL